MQSYNLKDGDRVVASSASPILYDRDLGAWLVSGSLRIEDAGKHYDLVLLTTLMSTVRFIQQWTLPEQIKVRFVRSYVAPDPNDENDLRLQAKLALDILFETLDKLDARQSDIDVSEHSVQTALRFCEEDIALIAPGRAAEIGAGIERMLEKGNPVPAPAPIAEGVSG